MTLSLDAATDVLAQIHEELGDFDPGMRAVVALRSTGESSLELADVQLADNGVLDVEDDVAGIVLVTGDRVELADRPEPVAVRHAVVVLRDGAEVGLFRLGEDDTLHRWSNVGGDDEDARVMRPREPAANVARRAFGLPSVVDDVPVTELVSRVWSVHVAQVALRLFDERGAKEPVPLHAVSDEVLATEPDVDLDGLTWAGARRLAMSGQLAFGPHRFDAEHASWLDTAGFAQHVVATVPQPEEFIDTLEVVVDGDLLGWVVAELERRGWRSPEVAPGT